MLGEGEESAVNKRPGRGEGGGGTNGKGKRCVCVCGGGGGGGGGGILKVKGKTYPIPPLQPQIRLLYSPVIV